MGLISREVFVGHDDKLAGEAVAEGVEGRSAFTGVGFGAGGVLGVGSVVSVRLGVDILVSFRSGDNMGPWGAERVGLGGG